MERNSRSLTPRPDLLSSKFKPDSFNTLEEEDDSSNKHVILIHKELDKIKSENRKKQSIISKLKQDIAAEKRKSLIFSEDKTSLDSRLQHLEEYLEAIISKRKDEETSIKSYRYLLDRIKEDKKYLDIELQKQQSDLSKNKNYFNSQDKKTKKIHEISLRKKEILRSLYGEISAEKKSQDDNLLFIEKKASERSKAVEILEESNKHRELIADAAQSQISNVETLDLRNKLLMLKLWYSFVNRKLERELIKGGIFEEPFQKIRATTGMQTVEDIMTRFLTREETYKDLVRAVSDAELKINELKRKVSESSELLKFLSVKKGEVEDVDVEQELIRNEKRSLLNYKEMYKKYKILIRSIEEWSKKQLKFNDVRPDGEDFNGLFGKVLNFTKKMMENIRTSEGFDKELMEKILFSSKDELLKNKVFLKYFEKNCRVEPKKENTDENISALLIGIN